MFSLNTCLEPGCCKNSLSSFNSNGEIIEVPGYCLDHTADKESVKQKIYDYINTHDKIIGLDASGLLFENIEPTKDFTAAILCTVNSSTFSQQASEAE